MKTKILSNRTKITKHRTIKIKVDKFIVTEKYLNNILQSQVWSIDGGFITTHPDAYDHRRMRFAYYDDLSFLDTEDLFWCNWDEIIPKSTMITDWNNFNGISNMLCIYLNMDGNIYKINSSNPIPIWRKQDYISGFCNNEYDLDKVSKLLQNKKYIRNVQIIDIPWYNQDHDCTKAVQFEYKLPSKKSLALKLKRNKMFKDHYFRT